MAPVFDFLYRFARVFHSDFRNRNFPPPSVNAAFRYALHSI